MSAFRFRVLGVTEAKRQFGAVMSGMPEARLREMRWLGKEGVKYLRQEAPFRTGKLRQGMTYRVIYHDPQKTTIGWFSGATNAEGRNYTDWVIRGRGPVVAKHAKALRFEPGPPGSGFIFRRRVGPSKANPFDVRVRGRLANHPIVVARRIATGINRIFYGGRAQGMYGRGGALNIG